MALRGCQSGSQHKFNELRERRERREREREREREDLMEANQNTDRDARFVCASAQPEELAAGHLPRNAS